MPGTKKQGKVFFSADRLPLRNYLLCFFRLDSFWRSGGFCPRACYQTSDAKPIHSMTPWWAKKLSWGLNKLASV